MIVFTYSRAARQQAASKDLLEIVQVRFFIPNFSEGRLKAALRRKLCPKVDVILTFHGGYLLGNGSRNELTDRNIVVLRYLFKAVMKGIGELNIQRAQYPRLDFKPEKSTFVSRIITMPITTIP